MADSKISALTEKTTFGDTDFLAGTQGTGANDNRKYGKTALQDAVGAIPLSGTTGENPVTGDIKMVKDSAEVINIGNDRPATGFNAPRIILQNQSSGSVSGQKRLQLRSGIIILSVEGETPLNRTEVAFDNLNITSYVDGLFYQKKYRDLVEYVDDQDIEISDSTKGIILTSPNSTRYRVTVENDGTLTTTAL